ncbi:MAG: hypothetical protein AB1656_11960 [Candidatus Omnitrophota bacterium]
MIVILSVLKDQPVYPLLLTSTNESISKLRSLFEIKQPPQEIDGETDESLLPARKDLLIFFIQQATSKMIGPWLNGWRSQIASSPGTLLVIRHADFMDFQREAPDLASFFGSKNQDSASMLSLWNKETAQNIKINLPKELHDILIKLPGELPSKKEIEFWIKQHPPIDA